MSFDTLIRNRKTLTITLSVAVIVVAVLLVLIKMGVISADTSTTTTYSYNGTLKTYTGHKAPNKVITNGKLTLLYYYKAGNCTGTSEPTQPEKNQFKTDNRGSLTIPGLSAGCYSGYIEGTLGANYIKSNVNVPVPAVRIVTARNLTSSNNQYRIVGQFTPKTVTVTTSPRSSATTTSTVTTGTAPATGYSIIGTVKDKDNNPIRNAKLVNSAPQYSLSQGISCLASSGGPAIDKSTTTDANGAFTLAGMSAGCFTIKIVPGCRGDACATGGAATAANSFVVVVNSDGTSTGDITLPDGSHVLYTIGKTPTTQPTPTPTPATPVVPPGANSTISGDILLMSGSSSKLAPGSGIIESAASNQGPWVTLANISNGKYSGSLNAAGSTVYLRARDINNPACLFKVTDEYGGESTSPISGIFPFAIKSGANTAKNITLNCDGGDVADMGRIIITVKKGTQTITNGSLLVLYNEGPNSGKEAGRMSQANEKGEFILDVPEAGTYKIKHGFYGCPGNNAIPKLYLPEFANVTVQIGQRSSKTLDLYCPSGS